MMFYRVVTGQEIPGKPGKVRKSDIRSRKSGKSQGILLILQSIRKKSGKNFLLIFDNKFLGAF